jgi:hypothetical protein
VDGVGKSEQAIVSQKRSNEPDISEVDLWGSGCVLSRHPWQELHPLEAY